MFKNLFSLFLVFVLITHSLGSEVSQRVKNRMNFIKSYLSQNQFNKCSKTKELISYVENEMEKVENFSPPYNEEYSDNDLTQMMNFLEKMKSVVKLCTDGSSSVFGYIWNWLKGVTPVILVGVVVLSAFFWGNSLFAEKHHVPKLMISGPPIILKGHKSVVSSVSWSSNGKHLISSSYDKTIKIWGIPTKKKKSKKLEVLITKVSKYPVLSATLVKDGSLIVGSLKKNHLLGIWHKDKNKKALQRKLNWHTGVVTSIDIGSDGKRVASTSLDGTIRIWDLSLGKLLKTLSSGSFNVHSVKWNPKDKNIIASAIDDTIKVWDVAQGEELFELHDNAYFMAKNFIRSIDYSPEGKYIASTAVDNRITYWDVKNRKILKVFKAHNKFIRSLSFSPNGSYVVSMSNDKSFKVWNFPEGELVLSVEGLPKAVYSVSWHPKMKSIVTGTGDGLIKIWPIYFQ